MRAGLVDKLFPLVFAAGLSAMVHGGVAVYALVADIERPEEPALEIIVLDEIPAPTGPEPTEPDIAPQMAPADAPADAAAPAQPTAMGLPPTVPEPATEAERPRWRSRLAALNRAFEKSEREANAQLAVLKGAVPARESKEGVRRCGPGAMDGPTLARTPTRSFARLAPLMPEGFMNAAYLERVGELSRQRNNGRLSFDLALPAELIRIRLDEPAHTLVVAGRADTQCLLRIELSEDLFPLRFYGLPIQVVSPDNTVSSAVVDLEVRVDATVRLIRQQGGPVGFTEVKLRHSGELAHTLKGHQGIFTALRALVE